MTQTAQIIQTIFAALDAGTPVGRVHRCPRCARSMAKPAACANCIQAEARERWQRIGEEALARVPASFRGISREHPLIANTWRLGIYRAARQALSPKGENKAFVVLTGDTGAGKSVIAAALVRVIADDAVKSESRAQRAHGVRWYSSKDISEAARNTKLGVEPEVIRDAKRATFLVLDELGAESQTQDVRGVLYERHAQGRMTVVTTYLTRGQMELRYDAGGGRRLVEATHSALLEVRP